MEIENININNSNENVNNTINNTPIINNNNTNNTNNNNNNNNHDSNNNQNLNKSLEVLKSKIIQTNILIVKYKDLQTINNNLSEENQKLKIALKNALDTNLLIANNNNNNNNNSNNNSLNNESSYYNNLYLNEKKETNNLKFLLEKEIGKLQPLNNKIEELKKEIESLHKTIGERDGEIISLKQLSNQLTARVMEYRNGTENFEKISKKLEQYKEYKKRFIDNKKKFDILKQEKEHLIKRCKLMKCSKCADDVSPIKTSRNNKKQDKEDEEDYENILNNTNTNNNNDNDNNNNNNNNITINTIDNEEEFDDLINQLDNKKEDIEQQQQEKEDEEKKEDQKLSIKEDNYVNYIRQDFDDRDFMDYGGLENNDHNDDAEEEFYRKQKEDQEKEKFEKQKKLEDEEKQDKINEINKKEIKNPFFDDLNDDSDNEEFKDKIGKKDINNNNNNENSIEKEIINSINSNNNSDNNIINSNNDDDHMDIEWEESTSKSPINSEPMKDEQVVKTVAAPLIFTNLTKSTPTSIAINIKESLTESNDDNENYFDDDDIPEFSSNNSNNSNGNLMNDQVEEDDLLLIKNNKSVEHKEIQEFENEEIERKEKELIEKQEKERQEKELIEKELIEKKLKEKELKGKELKLEQQRLEIERVIKEKERLEIERLEKEKIEREKIEREKIERERKEKEKLKREQDAAKEKEKQEKLKKLEEETFENERLEKERLEKIEKDRVEKERMEKERIEKERIEKEKENELSNSSYDDLMDMLESTTDKIVANENVTVDTIAKSTEKMTESSTNSTIPAITTPPSIASSSVPSLPKPSIVKKTIPKKSSISNIIKERDIKNPPVNIQSQKSNITTTILPSTSTTTTTTTTTTPTSPRISTTLMTNTLTSNDKNNSNTEILNNNNELSTSSTSSTLPIIEQPSILNNDIESLITSPSFSSSSSTPIIISRDPSSLSISPINSPISPGIIFSADSSTSASILENKITSQIKSTNKTKSNIAITTSSSTNNNNNIKSPEKKKESSLSTTLLKRKVLDSELKPQKPQQTKPTNNNISKRIKTSNNSNDKFKLLKSSYFIKQLKSNLNIKKESIESIYNQFKFETWLENSGKQSTDDEIFIWCKKLIYSIVQYLLELSNQCTTLKLLSNNDEQSKLLYPIISLISKLIKSINNNNNNNSAGSKFKEEILKYFRNSIVTNRIISIKNEKQIIKENQSNVFCFIYSSVCHCINEPYKIKSLLIDIIKNTVEPNQFRIDLFTIVFNTTPYLFKSKDQFIVTIYQCLNYYYQSLQQIKPNIKSNSDNLNQIKKFKKFFQSVNVPLNNTQTLNLQNYSNNLIKEFEKKMTTIKNLLINNQQVSGSESPSLDSNHYKEIFSILINLELVSIHMGWVWSYNELIAVRLWTEIEIQDDQIRSLIIQSIGSMCGNHYYDTELKNGIENIRDNLLIILTTDDYGFTFNDKLQSVLALLQFTNSHNDSSILNSIKEWYSKLTNSQKSLLPNIIKVLF